MSKSTVYIIGAGASNEARLPVGEALKSHIANLLDIRFDSGKQIAGDYTVTEALRIHVRNSEELENDINPFLHESWHIRDAMPQAISIDNFLDSQRENEKIVLCGKLGIARAILEAEAQSALAVEINVSRPRMNFDSLRNTWYLKFFRSLTENCSREDLPGRFQLVSLIVFNYDRCIEHFLIYALQNYYRISAEEASELVQQISIYHPYGKVGNLPMAGLANSIEFGAEPSATDLLELSRNIRTFTEGVDPASSDIEAIHQTLNEAERIAFIGFAFHPLNMQLITPSNVFGDINREIEIYATAYEISLNDQAVIKKQVLELVGGATSVNLDDITCNEFFTEFQRSLSFAY